MPTHRLMSVAASCPSGDHAHHKSDRVIASAAGEVAKLLGSGVGEGEPTRRGDVAASLPRSVRISGSNRKACSKSRP